MYKNLPFFLNLHFDLTCSNFHENASSISSAISGRSDSSVEIEKTSNVNKQYIRNRENANLTLQNFYYLRETGVNAFYESLDKETSCGQTNFYKFFSSPYDRVILYSLTLLSPSNTLVDICPVHFRRSLRKIINIQYPSFSCKKIYLLQLYNSLTNWLKSRALESIKGEITETIWNSYIKARYRNRKRKHLNLNDNPKV